MRHAQLLKDHYTCRICKVMTHHSSQLICDHVIPHRGDPTLFWQGELQTLCATCHSSTKQALERTGKTKHTTGQDGWPIS
jgi:5-methylcytosine-specific restriction endonuclease McrA